MSKSEVQRFVEHLKANPALRGNLKSGERFGAAEAVKVAGQHGYRFSLDDAKAFIQERAQASGRELSDHQLDKVTGGVADGCMSCWSGRTGRG